ncbi:MAG TPA: hypothetical protein VF937_18300 [Chloroflexota bacterium]
MAIDGDILAVAEGVDLRLARSAWDTTALAAEDTEVAAAAEIAVFALELAGKRRQARRGGRFGRLVIRFALAACLTLATFAAACDKPDANPEATQVAISELPTLSGASASIAAQPRASPAQFTDLVLLDAGSDARPWAILLSGGQDSPILVDRNGAGLDTVGGVYRLAAQPITVGTRDGTSQFLDPLQPAVATGTDTQAATSTSREQVVQRWSQDERYLAPSRALSGQLTVLDAAYNASAAATAGGTHTYLNGVVLRVEPDKPVLQVVDRALLESGMPTRAEDVVYVAIRGSERSLYEPGQVVNLRDVVIDKQATDVNGQSTTVYVANAALDGARVEPTGSVNLQSMLQPRLQRVDQDLSAQSQAAAATPSLPSATATPGAASTNPAQPIIVQQRSAGPSLVDDFLIWMWLSNTGFYRGPTVIINNPPPSSSRPSGDVYYSPPPAPSGGSPSTVASSQAAARSTALEASRSGVSGQAAGTGGGVAATNKSAADASARVSAATAKSASVAADVSTASVGKSTASVPRASTGTAARSAGNTAAGTRGSAGLSSGSSGARAGSGSSSGSSGSKGIGGSSSGFGGKGIGGSSSS